MTPIASSAVERPLGNAIWRSTSAAVGHAPRQRPFNFLNPFRIRSYEDHNAARPLRPQALAAPRIITALIFRAHGTQKLFGFPAPPGSGLPPAFSLFWVGAVLELAGEILILLGLFTRPLAFILSGEMATAYWMFHAPRSFYPVLNGSDAPILYSFIFLLFVFTGAGAWSFDAARRRTAPRGQALTRLDGDPGRAA